MIASLDVLPALQCTLSAAGAGPRRASQLVSLARRLERPEQPVGAPRSVRRDALRGPSDLQPLVIDAVRLLGIDGHLAGAVAGLGFAHAHGLMPAVCPGDRIGVYGEGDVLVDADLGPPDAQRVRVARS